MIEILNDTYQIQGIPTLLMFNKDGILIDDKARMTVQQNRENAVDKWKGA